MKRVLVTFLLASLVITTVAVVGCEDNGNRGGILDGNTGSSGGQTGDTGNTGATSTDPDAGNTGDAGSTGNTGGDTDFETSDTGDTDICDAQDFNISFVPTRLMILQDMSSSMREGSPTKWAQAQAAIRAMLENPKNALIQFGFDSFPRGGNCNADGPTAFVDCAPQNAQNILAQIAEIYVSSAGLTPLCQAMVNFDESVVPNYAPQCMADGANQYLLVVSDGEANCGNAALQCAGGAKGYPSPNELAAKAVNLIDQNGMKTFVIGFGDGVEAIQLNAIAMAGGTSFTEYIQADDQAQLQTALESITQTVLSCSFEIDEPDEAADPDKVNFLIDGVQVGRDDSCTQDGWRWTDAEHTQVEFCGNLCDRIMSSSVNKVSATFGCPTEVMVPVK